MFKKKFLQILQSLGFVEKAKQNQLSEEEWTLIENTFKEEFGMSMSELMLENQRTQALEEERTAALLLINQSSQEEDAPESQNSIIEGISTIQQQLEDQIKENRRIQEQLETISKKPQEDKPIQEIKSKLSVFGPGTNQTHLFGIEDEMFSLEKRWNKISANPNVARLSSPEKSDARAFKDEVHKYAAAISARFKFLKENKMLPSKMDSLFSDQDIDNVGLGKQYVTLRQDALIARILEIPTVYDLFPRRYGIQDRELMTIAYFDELSQAYQPGHVFKGGVKLQPEMGYVDDAMFKTKFGPMKEIERLYIGYLNTDGSDPMKWSMIEWQLLNMYKVLVNEKNIRVIRGCFVAPESGVPGSYLNAGTGLVYTLQRYYHENKLLPHSDTSYNNYSETTMLDSVSAFLDDVIETLDENDNLENKFLYLNDRHKSWWIKNIRSKFGKDTDFSGTNSYLNIVPDYGIQIKWVPNLGNSKLMFIQEHGNLQALEFIPGEMLAVDFDTEMELMNVWSTWKEGFSGYIVGKQFNSFEELKNNEYSMQEIFMNHPAELLEDGATSIDAKKNYWFLTSSNTSATQLSEIKNAKRGVVYVVEIGDKNNATTIAKSGVFEKLEKAFSPKKKGDYIMIVLNKDDKFVELERRENGVRSINTTLQPNIIGGRK